MKQVKPHAKVIFTALSFPKILPLVTREVWRGKQLLCSGSISSAAIAAAHVSL